MHVAASEVRWLAPHVVSETLPAIVRVAAATATDALQARNSTSSRFLINNSYAIVRPAIDSLLPGIRRHRVGVALKAESVGAVRHI